jgi:hypothetical protein
MLADADCTVMPELASQKLDCYPVGQYRAANPPPDRHAIRCPEQMPIRDATVRERRTPDRSPI